MKRKIFSILILLLSITITYLICDFKFKQQQAELKNDIIKEIYQKYENLRKNDDKNNDCSIEYIINAYEHLFDDGRGSGMARYYEYKHTESEKLLKSFIKDVHKNFSSDQEFLDLFNYNVELLNNLSIKNIKTFYPDTEFDLNKVGYISPFAESLKTSSEYEFKTVELNYLQEFLSSYCHTRQDNDSCIKMVFNKYK